MEDYEVEIVELDFGDAPDPTFPTLQASNGPRHIIGGPLFLGASVDQDNDGQQTATADGDDTDLDGDDEDDVFFLSTLLKAATSTLASFEVISSGGGNLDAWIDFNGNGAFDDPAEHLGGGASIPVIDGSNVITFAVPSTSTAGATFGRFRLSSAGGLAPTGEASEGEVEDYSVTIIDGTAPISISVDLPTAGGSFEAILSAGDLIVRDDTGTILFQVPFSSVSDIVIIGSDNADTLTVNFGGGDPIPPGIMTFDGGLGFDSMFLTGGSVTDAVFGYANDTDGSADLDGSLINYFNLAPITSTIAATNVTLNYSTAAETITVTDAAGGSTTVDSNLGEITTFIHPTGTLTINAGDTGNDTVNIMSLAANYPANIVIDGEGGSDEINVNGSVSTNGNDVNLAAETVNTTSSIAVAGGAINITTDTIAIGDVLSGTGMLTIVPQTANRTIGIGTGSGLLNINVTEISRLADGFSLITIGDTTNTGAVDVGSSSFFDPITIIGDSIAVTGLNSNGNDASLTADNGAHRRQRRRIHRPHGCSRNSDTCSHNGHRRGHRRLVDQLDEYKWYGRHYRKRRLRPDRCVTRVKHNNAQDTRYIYQWKCFGNRCIQHWADNGRDNHRPGW